MLIGVLGIDPKGLVQKQQYSLRHATKYAKASIIQTLLREAPTPALIIDCANIADPHRLGIPQERLHEYQVIPIELLYAFRDIAKDLAQGTAKENAGAAAYAQYKSIIITPMDILFNYHDEKENLAMYSQAWERLRASPQTIYIGVRSATIHERYARLYCDKIIMGHTASSQRVTLGVIEQELRAYARSLPPPEQALFEKLMLAPAQHVGSITYASSLHAWAFLLLSINLEQEKRLQLLEEAYEDLAHRYLPKQELDRPLDQAGIAQYQD